MAACCVLQPKACYPQAFLGECFARFGESSCADAMAEEPTNAATFAALVEMAELPGGKTPPGTRAVPMRHLLFEFPKGILTFFTFIPA